MKLKDKYLSLFLMLFLLSACNSDSIVKFNNPNSMVKNFNVNIKNGKRIKKIIVIVTNHNNDEKYISYAVKKNLINKGYTLPDRENLPAVQKEMSFCRSHLTRRCQIKLGSLTNADSILKIEKINLGQDYTLAAELIDLASGNIRWTQTSREMDTDNVIGTLLNKEIDKWLTKKGYSRKDHKEKRKTSRQILDGKISSLMKSLPQSYNSTALH